MQERRNFIANALKLRLSCTNPSISCVLMAWWWKEPGTRSKRCHWPCCHEYRHPNGEGTSCYSFSCVENYTFMMRQASKHLYWAVGEVNVYHNDVIMGTMASQITSLTIVYSTVYSGADKKIKAPRHWPLCGEFTGDRWIPRTNGQ